MTWIQTRCGEAVDLLDPKPETIRLDDIAYALARICRYTGHVPWYSVAEHSVHVSFLVRPELALAGLLHDAAEAYVQDLSSPMRRAMRELSENASPYEEIASRVEVAIWKRFGLESAVAKTAEIKAADLAMLAAEAERFFPAAQRPRDWMLAPDPELLERARRRLAESAEWPAATAEQRFLGRLWWLQ